MSAQTIAFLKSASIGLVGLIVLLVSIGIVYAMFGETWAGMWGVGALSVLLVAAMRSYPA